MSEVKVEKSKCGPCYSGELVKYLPIVQIDGTYYVPVSHSEIDWLIGRLMQMFELIGDTEQRSALKSETKMRIRGWLDSEYSARGYDKFEGIREGAKVIK